MKKIKLIVTFSTCMIFLLCISTGCSDKTNPVKPETGTSLVGSWNINSMRWDYQDEIGSYSKAQLDSVGLIWTLTFNADFTAEQTTNLSGQLVTMPGTWTKSGTQLIITLNHPSGTSGTMNYEYVIAGGILKLQWQIPAGTEFYAEFENEEMISE